MLFGVFGVFGHFIHPPVEDYCYKIKESFNDAWGDREYGCKFRYGGVDSRGYPADFITIKVPPKAEKYMMPFFLDWIPRYLVLKSVYLDNDGKIVESNALEINLNEVGYEYNSDQGEVEVPLTLSKVPYNYDSDESSKSPDGPYREFTFPNSALPVENCVVRPMSVAKKIYSHEVSVDYEQTMVLNYRLYDEYQKKQSQKSTAQAQKLAARKKKIENMKIGDSSISQIVKYMAGTTGAVKWEDLDGDIYVRIARPGHSAHLRFTSTKMYTNEDELWGIVVDGKSCANILSKQELCIKKVAEQEK